MQSQGLSLHQAQSVTLVSHRGRVYQLTTSSVTVVHALDEWQRRILHLTHNNTHNCHRERERATALPDL